MPEDFNEQTGIAGSTEQAEQSVLLAGKYKTAADLEAGYRELEKKHGELAYRVGHQQTDSPQPRQDDSQGHDGPLEIGINPISKILHSVGVDEKTIIEQYVTKGSLQNDIYDKFKSKGYGRVEVDAFLEGQKAIAELNLMRTRSAAAAAVERMGGEDVKNKLFIWAKNNLSTEEIIEFDNKFKSGDTNAALMAADALQMAYERATGTKQAPTRTTGGVPPASASSGGVSNITEFRDLMKQIRSDPTNPVLLDKLAKTPFEIATQFKSTGE